MKTIGLIGGMSWESTAQYYKIINEKVKEKLGGLNSAKCILYSVNFEEVEKCQSAGDWEKSGEIIIDAGQRLEKAGADFLVICTNTMHKVAEALTAAVSLPLLHIADVTADALLNSGIRKALLLGTKYTMEQDFYTGRLKERGIDTIVPAVKDRELVNSVIFGELCLGKICDKSRKAFEEIINKSIAAGAAGAVLGCTEIGMLISAGDTSVPVFDTAYLHAAAAAEKALA